jgi:hypothetical protein
MERDVLKKERTLFSNAIVGQIEYIKQCMIDNVCKEEIVDEGRKLYGIFLAFESVHEAYDVTIPEENAEEWEKSDDYYRAVLARYMTVLRELKTYTPAAPEPPTFPTFKVTLTFDDNTHIEIPADPATPDDSRPQITNLATANTDTPDVKPDEQAITNETQNDTGVCDTSSKIFAIARVADKDDTRNKVRTRSRRRTRVLGNTAAAATATTTIPTLTYKSAHHRWQVTLALVHRSPELRSTAISRDRTM